VCCDVCDGPRAPWGVVAAFGSGAQTRSRGDGRGHTGRRVGTVAVPAPDLDRAIVEVVGSARPPVGRTRAVEILRGGRSKVIFENAYDGLALYGAFAHLRSDDVLGRVDELLADGTLRSTGGRFPKLRAA
jgi:ATP-dependent DNA helicase RecQ